MRHEISFAFTLFYKNQFYKNVQAEIGGIFFIRNLFIRNLKFVILQYIVIVLLIIEKKRKFKKFLVYIGIIHTFKIGKIGSPIMKKICRPFLSGRSKFTPIRASVKRTNKVVPAKFGSFKGTYFFL